MLILGIESSCDETAASIARNHTEILSNVVSSQVEEHKQYGGVVPEIASRRHCENVLPVVQKALDDAGVTLAELDGIAVTAYPGLIGALLVGVNFAKGLALTAGKPLVPTHHLAGHIAANYIAHPELKPPYLCLVVSGGHSHLVEVLYEIPDSGTDTGRCRRGVLRQVCPCYGLSVSRRHSSGQSVPVRQPESIFSAKTENCGKCL